MVYQSRAFEGASGKASEAVLPAPRPFFAEAPTPSSVVQRYSKRKFDPEGEEFDPEEAAAEDLANARLDQRFEKPTKKEPRPPFYSDTRDNLLKKQKVRPPTAAERTAEPLLANVVPSSLGDVKLGPKNLELRPTSDGRVNDEQPPVDHTTQPFVAFREAARDLAEEDSPPGSPATLTAAFRSVSNDEKNLEVIPKNAHTKKPTDTAEDLTKKQVQEAKDEIAHRAANLSPRALRYRDELRKKASTPAWSPFK